MTWILGEDEKGYYYEKVDDTVQGSDKSHNKCVDLFYQTIQELDKRVLFEDDIKELYSLAGCLKSLYSCIVDYERARIITYSERQNLLKYINEVKSLIYRKSKICVIF